MYGMYVKETTDSMSGMVGIKTVDENVAMDFAGPYLISSNQK